MGGGGVEAGARGGEAARRQGIRVSKGRSIEVLMCSGTRSAGLGMRDGERDVVRMDAGQRQVHAALLTRQPASLSTI